MDLKTFIKETLVQIVDAVVDAQTDVENKGAVINPRMAEELRQPAPGVFKKHIPDPELVSQLGFYLTADNRKTDMIEFDVAVTASSSAEESATAKGGAKAGVGIHVVSLEVGGKTESGSGITRTDERVSRVKFRIPIALPQR